MTTTQQPHPLYLAKQLDKYADGTVLVAADEIRRLHARVVELESQLEAIGAGGVESLRGAKPLTDEQIMELFEKHYSHDQPQGKYFVEIVRHAERAHKIGS